MTIFLPTIPNLNITEISDLSYIQPGMIKPIKWTWVSPFLIERSISTCTNPGHKVFFSSEQWKRNHKWGKHRIIALRRRTLWCHHLRVILARKQSSQSLPPPIRKMNWKAKKRYRRSLTELWPPNLTKWSREITNALTIYQCICKTTTAELLWLIRWDGHW